MNIPAQPKERWGKQLLRTMNQNKSVTIGCGIGLLLQDNKGRGIFCPSGDGDDRRQQDSAATE